MRTLTLEELLEAGCHFGHQVTRQNPKSREFVFEARDNIHIIDLEKTKEGLENAATFVKEIAQQPDSSILILGTKRQAGIILKEEVQRATDAGANNIFTVTTRWIGGTLTNFNEVKKNSDRLKDLTKKLQDDFEKMKYTKKEISLWDKSRQKLTIYYGGVQDMTKAPDLLFIIDTHLEDLAVREGNAMGVPVVGIVDTNADPDPVTYPIPANDDAAGSIKLIVAYIVDAWIEGKKKAQKAANTEAQKAANTENAEESQKTQKETVGETKGTKGTSTEAKAEETKGTKKPAEKVKSEKVKEVAKVEKQESKKETKDIKNVTKEAKPTKKTLKKTTKES